MSGQPNIERSNNPQVVTGGEFGVIINGGTAGITFEGGNITTADSITAGHLTATDIHLTAATNEDAVNIGLGKIRGDFSTSLSSTGSSRSYVQTNTANSRTHFSVVPNGVPVSGATSAFMAFGMNDTSTSSYVGLFSNPLGGVNVLQSNANTTGTVYPLRLLVGNSGSHGITLYPTKDVIVNSEVVATTATSGFLYIPTCAGVPTGVPTAYANTAPLVIDSTNSKMYFYSGGAWNALN